MPNKIILPILSCLITMSVAAQKLSVSIKYETSRAHAGNGTIYYDTDRKLTWSDFQGTPSGPAEEAALTSAGLGIDEAYSSAGTLVINVYCDFDKSKSWVKPEGHNEYILKHEQDHFDIAYISTLLFIKELCEAHFTSSNYNTLISEIYKKAVTDMWNLQDQYDTETNHSTIKDKQEEWNHKIAKQIQALEASVQK